MMEEGKICFLVGQRSTLRMREFLPDGSCFLSKPQGEENATSGDGERASVLTGTLTRVSRLLSSLLRLQMMTL